MRLLYVMHEATGGGGGVCVKELGGGGVKCLGEGRVSEH